MSTTNCPSIGPQDSLRRDSLIPPAVTHGRLAFKIAVGALLGLLLAIAGNLAGEPTGPVERLTLPQVEPAPAPAQEPVFDGHGKWGGYAR